MQIHHIYLWSERIFQSQWRYFYHICSKSFDHIGMTAYRWNPSLTWTDYASNGFHVLYRKIGRPKIKWDDHIRKFCKYCFGEYEQDFAWQISQWSHVLLFYESKYVKFHI